MAEPPPALIEKVLTVDTKFSHYLHSKFHTLLPIFFHLILEISADFRFSFPISFSLLFTLSLPSLLPFFSSLLLGLLLDLAVVGLIKILFRRPRPPYNHLSSMSTPVSADHFSFPSGHSSRVSFVAALVFLYKEAMEVAAVEVREKGGVFGSWVGEEGKLVNVVVVGVCAWAVVTAVSRVLLGRHYFFDVFAGFCLGMIEGVFAYRVLRFEDLFSAVVGLGIGEIMIVDCQKCRNVTVKLSCKARFSDEATFDIKSCQGRSQVLGMEGMGDTSFETHRMDLSGFILMPDPYSRDHFL
ncbi:hypothetical protein SADUNF_Sadunf03G0081000 [Salix dunnii]|uniref:Phosphatidic acid phosphatase type 2/haloperoxidase domain-containing protein n=1 Tax=Salix dunnii TaxID=1413687 RepID=A0A835K9N1_9ROSI|nr:hypothetical protein SADUNF_Sadunf03G0081000 [Salix dunnii]